MVTVLDLEPVNDAQILVVGCGGAGGNAIDTMIDSGEVEFVDFVAINTDSQALSKSKASVRLQIGETTRRGLGCGARPECGKAAAEADEDKIRNVLEEHDMIFITAGFGGGTGTGAAPVVARLAKEMGILTVAVISKPFTFEGKRKMALAESWIEELKENVDSLIVLSNQKIVETAGDVTFLEAFKLADNVLKSSVMGISDTIMKPGIMNIDFADVKTTLETSGEALIGLGYGSGENKVLDAVKTAISNPLVENLSIEGASSILINYTIGPDTNMNEIDTATDFITSQASENVTVIFGVIVNLDLTNGAQVTVVATRFNDVTEEIEIIEEEKVIIETPVLPMEAVQEVKPVEKEIIVEVETPKDLTSGYGPTKVVQKVKKTRRPRIPKIRRTEDLDIPTFLNNIR